MGGTYSKSSSASGTGFKGHANALSPRSALSIPSSARRSEGISSAASDADTHTGTTMSFAAMNVGQKISVPEHSLENIKKIVLKGKCEQDPSADLVASLSVPLRFNVLPWLEVSLLEDTDVPVADVRLLPLSRLLVTMLSGVEPSTFSGSDHSSLIQGLRLFRHCLHYVLASQELDSCPGLVESCLKEDLLADEPTSSSQEPSTGTSSSETVVDVENVRNAVVHPLTSMMQQLARLCVAVVGHEPGVYEFQVEVRSLLLMFWTIEAVEVSIPELHIHGTFSEMFSDEEGARFVHTLLDRFVQRQALPVRTIVSNMFRHMQSVALNPRLLFQQAFSYFKDIASERFRVLKERSAELADTSLLLLLATIFRSPTLEAVLKVPADSSAGGINAVTDTAEQCHNETLESTLGSLEVTVNPIADATPEPDAPEQCVKNVFARALSGLKDVPLTVDVSVDGGAITRESTNPEEYSFSVLFDAICKSIQKEKPAGALLLYYVLHHNSEFLDYVFARTDVDTLLLPLLRYLYVAGSVSHPDISTLYILVIVLLILSQDGHLNHEVHTQELEAVPWFKEVVLTEISLGSVMVLVLVRTLQLNCLKLKDAYINTNCLAILENMSPHFHGLHMYAAQKLVNVVNTFAKRYQTAETQLKSGKYVSPEDMVGHRESLRSSLEVLNAAICFALPRNANLVYAMVHQQKCFSQFLNHPDFCDLIQNIDTVLNHVNAKLRTIPQQTVLRVQECIHSSLRSWKGENITVYQGSKYRYEETSDPDEFFCPVIWSLVYSQRHHPHGEYVSAPSTGTGLDVSPHPAVSPY